MFLLVATILLAGSVTSDPLTLEDQGIDYRMLAASSVAPFDNNTDQCNSSLIVCADCLTLGICSIENGEWTIVGIGKCTNGDTCFKGQCISTENPTCPPTSDFPFMCTATGMFPDQGNCKAYHFCVKDGANPAALNHYKDACSEGYGYNPKTTYCDKKLSNKECTAYPVSMCKKIGESGPVKENPTLYYVCIEHPQAPAGQEDVLYPLLRACPNGRAFNPTSKQCNP